MRAYVLSLLFCNYQHRCCTTITLMNIIMIWWRIWISAELKLAIHIQTCHRLVHLGFQIVSIKMEKGGETTDKNTYWYIKFWPCSTLSYTVKCQHIRLHAKRRSKGDKAFNQWTAQPNIRFNRSCDVRNRPLFDKTVDQLCNSSLYTIKRTGRGSVISKDLESSHQNCENISLKIYLNFELDLDTMVFHIIILSWATRSQRQFCFSLFILEGSDLKTICIWEFRLR